MDDFSVVIRPLITEQTVHLADKRSAYAFEVNPVANKAQIRNAIERLYNVKVREVRTANHKGKRRRRGRISGQTSHWKKAVVVLEGEDHIDLF